VATLLLIRHGETVWNQEGRVQGHGNSPLNERGRAQARALAERLCDMPIDALYSSDLGRAIETIEPYARMCHLPVVTNSALREKNFGDWEGLTDVELEEQYAETWHRYHVLRDICITVPGGETWEQVATRTVTFLKYVVESHGVGATVALVGHGGSLRPPILHALRAPLTCLTRLSIDNGGITTLRFRGPDDGRIVSLNDCNHLAGIT
jgi:broad specificity phosphatase PhoE